MIAEPPWSVELRFSEVGRSPERRRLSADEPARARIARALGLEALESLDALVEVAPWLDGVELRGRWSAEVSQLCSLSGDPFDTPLQGEFAVRVLPPGSPNAPAVEAEVSVDPEAEDPPDVAEAEQIDLAAYVVEHLALEIDPFPRKPGAAFEAPEPEGPPSPFAALLQLKPKPGEP